MKEQGHQPASGRLREPVRACHCVNKQERAQGRALCKGGAQGLSGALSQWEKPPREAAGEGAWRGRVCPRGEHPSSPQATAGSWGPGGGRGGRAWAGHCHSGVKVGVGAVRMGSGWHRLSAEIPRGASGAGRGLKPRAGCPDPPTPRGPEARPAWPLGQGSAPPHAGHGAGGAGGARGCASNWSRVCTYAHTRTLAHSHTHSCTLTRAHSHSRTCTYTHLHSISHTHTYTLKLSYIHLHTHTLKLTLTHTHVHTYSPAVAHILILVLSNTHTHTCTLTHTRLHSHSQLGGHSVVAAHGDKGEDARAGRCWGPAGLAALLLRGPLSAQWAGWARAGRGGTLSHGQFSARAVSPGIWEAELTQLAARVYRSPPRRPAPESLPGPGDTASHASGHRSGQPVAGPTDHSEKALGHGGGCLRGHFPRRCASWTSPPRQWLSVRHERV